MLENKENKIGFISLCIETSFWNLNGLISLHFLFIQLINYKAQMSEKC